MVKWRYAVIFAAACGYFCNGVRYFLRRLRFCYIIFAVVFFNFCFLSLYFLRLFFHLFQFIFCKIRVKRFAYSGKRFAVSGKSP